MSTKEMEEIIKSLKIKHSHGYDKMTGKILKLNAPFINFSLTYMFNKSLSGGIFPTGIKFCV
jgi:hypothetical protein